MLKYIFMNVKERKMRTAVMLLSTLLSTTLLFVSFSIGASYESAQRKMARGMAGSAAISVTAVSGDINPHVLPELSSIRASAGIVEATALYHEEGYYETIDLIAADLTELAEINPPRLVSGGEITGFTGNQVILPDRFTSKYGIEKGDTITLKISGKPVSFQVAEIAAYDTVFLRHTRGATALVPRSTLSELSGRTDGCTEILVEPAQGISAARLKEELASSLPLGEYQVDEVVSESQIAADARQKTMPFFLISFFSLTMSVFIIYSSYKVITLDRLPVIGTFRSIGATQKAVVHILLSESALYGVAGGLMGIPAGALALKAILGGMGTSLSQGIQIPVVISPFSILFPFAAAVVVSLLSAWLPVRRASRLPIKDVVMGRAEERHIPRQWTAVAGAALFTASILFPRLASGTGLYLAGGLSLLGMIAAAILLVPLLTNLLSRWLEVICGAILGNEGRLSARNMRDNKNTAQNITLLFISISAVIVITVVGRFVTAYVGDVFKDAELQGFADGTMDSEFVTKVGEMEEQALLAFAGKRAILFSESGLDRIGCSVGDTITLTCPAGQYSYRIAGSFKSRATDVEAVISSADAVSDFGPSAYGFLAYTAADPDAIMVQIRDLFGETPNWSRTVEEFNTDALSTVNAFLQPMHSMTYFILLLAAVGIINNLLINYMQKRRSIAMYKSVGLSNRQNVKITLIEGFYVGLI
ncbi:ABC transporter permease, partial [Enterocloster sp.]|uniref:ABC transporter permease n=1 Tax=Enterocloster sp. TaxID=2719315 RepID=UPI00399F148B